MKQVPISKLQEGMIPGETIYEANGTILISTGLPLKKEDIELLIRANLSITDLAIQDTIDGQRLSLAEVTALQTEQVLKSIQAMLYESDLSEVFELADAAAKIDQMLRAILDKPTVQNNLKYILKNETLYHHSLHIAILALHMGMAKGYNYMNLEFLGTCALLHDIGQAEPLDMLKSLNTKFIKNSPTNEHVLAGFWALRENKELNILVALVALQHHEHFDGQGSPFGLRKNQITEFARLIAVADVFDNLLYVLKNPRVQAISKILERSKTQFDPQMIAIFEKAICKK
ncbi:MAG: HD domain-containing protein [Pelosinus sp.]|nr:HD domain-containing protein [Pelosinus sp.]